MANLLIRRSKWYSRVRLNSKHEKQIPLRTTSKTIAHKRNAIVEKYEDDIKSGLEFDFPWLKEGGKTVVKERSIGETLEEYYVVRNIEGIRRSTIERIQVSMKSLFTLMSPKTRLLSLNEDVIEKFKRHSKEVLGHKPNTININLSKIRCFLNWCHRKQYIKEMPYIYMVTVETGEVDYLFDVAINR